MRYIHHLKLTKNDTIGSLTVPRISSTSAITASPTFKLLKLDAAFKLDTLLNAFALGTKPHVFDTRHKAKTKLNNRCIIASLEILNNLCESGFLVMNQARKQYDHKRVKLPDY